MNKIKYFLIYFLFFYFSSLNANVSVKLEKVELDLNNKASLQKGAKVFFDYCQGCHGLKYMRYLDLAKGIGLDEARDKSLDAIIKEDLLKSVDSINENDNILTTISKDNGTKWFGKVPPDLSLIARYRGVDWLYTYMKSFYKDSSRPWGVNNLVFPDVGMPHILLKFQGLQVLSEDHKTLDLVEDGLLSKSEYDNLVKDLVTFLCYVGEPAKVERENIGYYVLGFLSILILLFYFLKKEYWQDVE